MNDGVEGVEGMKVRHMETVKQTESNARTLMVAGLKRTVCKGSGSAGAVLAGDIWLVGGAVVCRTAVTEEVVVADVRELLAF